MFFINFLGNGQHVFYSVDVVYSIGKSREKRPGLARDWHINQKKKNISLYKIFCQMATRIRLGWGTKSWLIKKDEKKQYWKQALNFSSDWPNFAKLHGLKDFFDVSLKNVWDPDWWPAKAFATVLCGKPSPCNIRYSSIQHGIFSPTVSSNTAAEVKGF